MKILKIFKKPVFLITLVVLAAVLSVSFLSVSAAGDFGEVTKYRVGMQGCLYLELTVDTTGMVADDYFEISVDGRTETETVKTSEITDGKFLVKLAPAEMNKTVTVTAKKADGTEGCTKTINVAEYAKKVLANPEHATTVHDQMRTLLNWGAKSEAFFGKGTTISIGDVFTRGSDPSTSVIKENIPKPSKDDVNATGVFAGQTHILDLILDEGNISLCFKLKASKDVGALEATVSRDGYKNNAKVTYGGGYYTVKVNGITTSRFDDVYTVTVSDGGTNSITAQASVLEYLYKILNDESVHPTKPTEQKATAQALFQFYQATTNAFSSATCTHQHKNFFWIHTGDASYSRCSVCFKTLGNKVPDSAKFYCTLDNMGYWKGNNPTVDMYSYDEENGVLYNRYTNSATVIFVGNETNDATVEKYQPGKYMVIKYRTTSGNLYFDRAGTANNASANITWGAVGMLQKTDNAWRVVIIDLSEFTYWPKEESQLYMYFTADTQADIAYVATFDNFADIKGLVETDDGILYSTIPTNNRGIAMTLTKRSVDYLDCTKSGHDITVKQVTVDGGTKYVYSCSKGDYDLCETTVPENINYYADLVTMNAWAGHGTVYEKYQYDDVNKVFYNKITVNGDGTDNNSTDTTFWVTGNQYKNADLTNARYLVLKYFMPNGANINFTIETGKDGQTVKTITSGELYATGGRWRVVVVDLGDAIKSAENTQIKITATVHNGADVAYVAVTDTLEEVRGLLNEQDKTGGSDVMLRMWKGGGTGAANQPGFVRSVDNPADDLTAFDVLTD